MNTGTIRYWYNKSTVLRVFICTAISMTVLNFNFLLISHNNNHNKYWVRINRSVVNIITLMFWVAQGRRDLSKYSVSRKLIEGPRGKWTRVFIRWRTNRWTNPLPMYLPYASQVMGREGNNLLTHFMVTALHI